MKSQTRNVYAQRIDQAVALLERAIKQGEDMPDPAALAQAAHLSPFHFHRVYRALTGETPGATMARLRMLQALRVLADPARSVTDASAMAGYDTPQAFARAFRQLCGVAPSEMRGDDARLQREIDRLGRAPGLPDVPATLLQVEVLSLEPFNVVAMRNRGAFEELDKAYERLFAWVAQRGAVEQVTGIYGRPWQDFRDVPPQALEFDCALRVSEPIEGDDEVRVQRWGEGRWARVRHVGAYELLEACCDQWLAYWLPHSGETLRDGERFHHFLDDPEDVPAPLCRADIYLPIV